MPGKDKSTNALFGASAAGDSFDAVSAATKSSFKHRNSNVLMRGGSGASCNACSDDEPTGCSDQTDAVASADSCSGSEEGPRRPCLLRPPFSDVLMEEETTCVKVSNLKHSMGLLSWEKVP